MTALKASAPLQTRVGIATGLVVVGDLIGSGEAQERGIVGETPNLAARLQGIADPNTVVIAEATRKLLGSLFELDEVGPKDLKGIAGPVRAFVALRPRSVESRFEALHASVLTALVGREEELEVLLRRWARAMNGEGQVVLLSGEPGIGKSRLTAALLERLAGEPHTRLRYFCSPQATDSALFPVIGQMERAAGFAYDDDAEAKLDKLEALASPEDVALLAELLSLPTVRYPASTASPQRKKEQTFTALLRQLEALARSRPALMLFVAGGGRTSTRKSPRSSKPASQALPTRSLNSLLITSPRRASATKRLHIGSAPASGPPRVRAISKPSPISGGVSKCSTPCPRAGSARSGSWRFRSL